MPSRAGKEKNKYLVAFFEKNKIEIGMSWRYADYMFWIDKRHSDFRKMKGMAEHITLNDAQVDEFVKYINEID